MSYNPAVQKKATAKYLQTEKGKAALKKYQQSEKFKATRRKYTTSEKFKQRRKEHPEIYSEPHFTNSVARLLQFQELVTKDDPESLTPDFICKMIMERKE